MGCRVLLLGAALSAALTVTGAGPASADDPTPAPVPTGVSTPSVSPPSQQQIDDAKSALDRLRNAGTTTPPTLTQVAGPVVPTKKDGSVIPRISDEAWWTIGAGVLVLLVASETTRIGVRRAKHRKRA